jgi:hypothetical protein
LKADVGNDGIETQQTKLPHRELFHCFFSPPTKAAHHVPQPRTPLLHSQPDSFWSEIAAPLIVFRDPPATACFDICETSSRDLPRTISVTINEQAIAAAHPRHLHFTSRIGPRSIRRVINRVSLSTGLFTIAARRIRQSAYVTWCRTVVSGSARCTWRKSPSRLNARLQGNYDTR